MSRQMLTQKRTAHVVTTSALPLATFPEVCPLCEWGFRTGERMRIIPQVGTCHRSCAALFAQQLDVIFDASNGATACSVALQ